MVTKACYQQPGASIYAESILQAAVEAIPPRNQTFEGNATVFRTPNNGNHC